MVSITSTQSIVADCGKSLQYKEVLQTVVCRTIQSIIADWYSLCSGKPIQNREHCSSKHVLLYKMYLRIIDKVVASVNFEMN